MKKLFVLTLALCALFLEVKGQNLSSEAQAAGFGAYKKSNLSGSSAWENDFDSYKYPANTADSMWFRLLLPNDYSSSREEPYPIIIFFHGAGEVGDDNRVQFINGGKMHRDAVVGGQFPGLLLYPQAPGDWKDYSQGIRHTDKVLFILRKLIGHFNVDPTRIYVEGLSMGGGGAWDFLLRNPQIVATAYPMCNVGGSSGGEYITSTNLAKTTFIPLWYSQGGLDNDLYSRQTYGNKIVNAIRNNGSEIRYLYWPERGHNVWTPTFSQPDFFSNMLEKSKLYIVPRHGQTNFCEGESFSVELGISGGYEIYYWEKAEENPEDENSWISYYTGPNNSITVTTPGHYRVRFRWNNSQSTHWGSNYDTPEERLTDWSKPIYVGNDRDTPVISISSQGKSVNFPALDGSTSVELSAPVGYDNYVWYRNEVEVPNSNNYSFTANQEGIYSASVWENAEPIHFSANGNDDVPVEFRAEPQGCKSSPTDLITITTSDNPGPNAPNNFFVTAISTSQIKIDWNDQSNNELGFEIYRALQSGGPYELITITEPMDSPNPQSFTDQNLTHSTTYYYRMRAVNNTGGSAYTQERSATTILDNLPPSQPTLEVVKTSRSSVELAWSGATDDGIIEGYEIYRDGILIDFIHGESYVVSGLAALTNFTFYVVTKDIAGNASRPSNQVSAVTANQGLTYKYYTVPTDITSVFEIEPGGTLIGEGTTGNFDISVRNNHSPTVHDYFAIIFEGSIYVENGGFYRFYLNSDDGSVLFIDGVQRVSRNRRTGAGKTTGNYFSLSSGLHTIRVLYFEASGDQRLDVGWERYGGNPSEQLIPTSVLKDEFVPPPSPASPSNLLANTVSYSRIDLTWNDNSSDETGFEIYRRNYGAGDFLIINTISADSEEYQDIDLSPSSHYEYQVRSINSNGASPFSNAADAHTESPPPLPLEPSGLTAIYVGNSIELSWVDSDDEMGYEIFRSTSPAGENWTPVARTSPDIVSFVDGEIYSNSTYYYKIRALGVVGFSGFSDVVSVSTGTNSLPSIEPIRDYTMVAEVDDPLVINIVCSDDDFEDIVILSVPTRPSFAEFQIQEGTNAIGIITFDPLVSDAGEYLITVVADDGNGGVTERTFTLIVYSAEPDVPPSAPGDFIAVALSPSSIDLSWTDNATNETEIKIYRSNNFTGPFDAQAEVVSLPIDTENYLDTDLAGNTTYYYKIIVSNESGFAESPVVGVSTLNSAPEFVGLERHIYATVGEEITLDIAVNDYDNMPQEISLLSVNFPDFMSFSDKGDGTGSITISPRRRDIGNHGGIRISAKDVLGAETVETIFVIVGDPQFIQQIFVNFNDQMNAGNPWNNTGAPGGSVSLNGALEEGTGIQISEVTGWNNSSDNGFVDIDNNGLFDNDIVRSNWTSNSSSSLLFSGLDPALIYQVLIFGSGNTVNTTTYTVNSVSQPLDTHENSDNVVTFNVENSDAFEITTNSQAVLNAIVLQVYSRLQLPSPSNFQTSTLSDSKVLLTWSDNSANETGFELYRRSLPDGNTELIFNGGANTEEYEDNNLLPGTSYEYSIRAVNSVEDVKSNFVFAVASTYEMMVRINMNQGVENVDKSTLEGWNHLEWAFAYERAEPWSGMVNSGDETTPISLNLIQTSGSAVNNTDGITVNPGDEGQFPNEIRKSFYYINQENPPSDWSLSGLNPGYFYDIIFFSSSHPDALKKYDIPEYNAYTLFEIGGIVKEINAVSNTSEVVEFKKLTPNSENEISFKFGVKNDAPPPLNNYGVLNAMLIQAYKNPDAITPSKTYYAQNAAPINVPGSWRTAPDGGDELGSLTEDGNELIISGGTRTLAGDVNFGGIGTKVRVTGNAEISISAGANDIFFNALEVEEGFTLTFNGTGGKNIRIGDGGLTIADGASIDLGGNSLAINGNATINKNEESGKLVMNEGSLTFNSTSQDDSHLYFDETANSVDHLIINNTGFGNVQLMTPTRLRERLKLSAGNLDTHDKLVLVHDGDGVALLDKVEVGASLSGMVEYQRYWERANNTSNFGYYHLGVPVKGQTFADWQGDFHIQGTDFSLPNRFPNVQRFDESTNNFVSMTSGAEVLVPGRGYTAFMYSSELADGHVFYDNIGLPIIGSGNDGQLSANETFEFPLAYSESESNSDPGWNFLANPYPCIIDMLEVDWESDVNDIDESVYVYDSEAFGYIVWNYEMVGENEPLKLYPGQGFFIKANGPDPLFRISENVKTTDKDDTRIYRKGSPENVLSFAIENTRGYRDKAYFGYRDNATVGMDAKYDAKKISGKVLSITSVFGDSLEYSINAIPESSTIKVVPLRLATSQKEQHKLTIDGINSMRVDKVFYLHDKYLNVTTQLPREEFEYPFEVNTDTTSYFDRFSLLTVPKPMLSIGTGEGFSEECVFVKMTGENLDGIARMQFEVKWDPSQLKFNSLDSMNTHLRSSEVDTLLIGEGILRFYYESETGVLPDIETMFNLNFTPLVDGTVADVSIENESVQLYIEQDALIPATIHSGQINILSKTLAKGSVLYKGSKPISNVGAKILPDLLFGYSDSNGEYGFTIKEGKSYSIHIEELKYDEFEIDVVDLIVLARHLYGRSAIHHPIDLLSADIDGNGTLNHKDFNELAKSIFSFRKNSKSPVGKKWIVANRFSSSIDGELPQPRDFAEVDDIFDFDIDFNVSVLGDIATNFDQGRKRSSHPDTTYLILNQVVANRDFYYSIEARNDEGLVGFQYSIEWNTDLVQLKAVEYALPGLIYDLDEEAGILKVMWVSDQEYIDVKGNTSLIGLRFEQLASLKLDNPVVFAGGEVPAVFIDGNLTSNAISIERKFGDSKGVNLISNYPNPFENSTTLSFSLNESENIEIVIYNAVGEPVGRFARTFEKGYHEWVWKPSPSLSKGIYFFNIRGTNSAAAGKMIYK